MISSLSKMWLSSLVSSMLVVVVLSASQGYLPPNKGYHYDKPNIPFEPNPTKHTTPGPGKFTSPTYIPPSPGPGPNPNPPDHGHDQHGHKNGDDHQHEPGMPFDFAYQVTEDGNDYSHNAISDGDITRGEYRVALPDGRTQIVKYTADWMNGFNAEVTYEGEARYPDPPAGGNGPSRYPDPPAGGNRPSNGGSQSYLPPNQGGGYQY